ncbi:ankyrin repeat-containing protein NPR4 [Ziziphus jujuba]|uniref:Ankyrin repeat-containing protein NPR4 n=1 Tax=Ziziphus jujuba TaxID=326968 RepID=A0ABM3ZW21_ZIZJJ|nr:ankyrin repeat-containing protein NPR4 [Ziziphus jujuba]
MEAKLYRAALYGSSTSSNSSSTKINDSTSEFNFSGGEDSDVLKVTKYQHNTILHVAAKSGNEKIARKILEAEATLALQTNKKLDTPLHIAARLGHAEVVSLLMTTDPSALQMVNMAKNTALHEAVCNGHHGIVELLVEKDPSLASLRNDAGESPLFMALDRKFHTISLLILKKCHDHEGLFFQGRNGMTAMHAAVIRLSKRNKVVQILDKLCKKLAKRCPKFKKYCDFIKGSPFELILEEEVLPKVLEKCGHGILEVRDDFGWLPLHYAAELGHVEIVKLFLTTNINLAYEKDSQEGMSALHIAARKGWIGLLKALVKERPDICELLDKKNRTALHVAVECGKKNATKTLLDMLDFKDLINDQDREGNTCLHLAALHGHHAILIMLASEKRVQKSVLNNKGMTAADIIKSSMQFSTVDKVSPKTTSWILIMHKHVRSSYQAIKCATCFELCKRQSN